MQVGSSCAVGVADNAKGSGEGASLVMGEMMPFPTRSTYPLKYSARFFSRAVWPQRREVLGFPRACHLTPPLPVASGQRAKEARGEGSLSDPEVLEGLHVRVSLSRLGKARLHKWREACILSRASGRDQRSHG